MAQTGLGTVPHEFLSSHEIHTHLCSPLKPPHPSRVSVRSISFGLMPLSQPQVLTVFSPGILQSSNCFQPHPSLAHVFRMVSKTQFSPCHSGSSSHHLLYLWNVSPPYWTTALMHKAVAHFYDHKAFATSPPPAKWIPSSLVFLLHVYVLCMYIHVCDYCYYRRKSFSLSLISCFPPPFFFNQVCSNIFTFSSTVNNLFPLENNPCFLLFECISSYPL